MKIKKFLATAVATVIMTQLINTAYAAPAPKTYADVPAGAWYANVASKWGYLLSDSSTVNPEAPVTRAEFAHAINTVMGFPSAAPKFSDVSDKTLYYEDIGALQAAGIVSGMGDGTYAPDSTVKRSEAAMIFALAFGMEPQGTPVFSDAKDIPDWVAPYVNTLYEGSYFQGDEKFAFNANNLLKRGEVFQVINVAAANYVDSDTPVNKVVAGNMIISAPGAVVSDVAVKGDIIIAPSVGEGEVTLHNVSLTGTLYVRGGGANSIKLTGKTSMDRLVASKAGSGDVRVVTEGEAKVSGVVVKGGDGNVKLEGKYETVHMTSQTAKLEINAEVANVNIVVPNTTVAISEKAVVNSVFASPQAANVAMTVSGKVESVQVAAPAAAIKVEATAVLKELGVAGAAVGATVDNKGKVEALVVKAADAEVANTGTITASSAPQTVTVTGTAPTTSTVIAAGSVNDVYAK